ncbi:SH3 domain-containing protein [Anabaena cylindrica UHCC 0172]|uniref:SH3 domain-containing protein n=1 Tax=Anabaena cylindrica TaxID=1165 RepID=UPI002B1F25A0|nr:SH3 domain-containing protein [Anabaena cylindrica]MEA5553570.1 SH3 domain-containing protein [Anabaena cylindrica UHCC 0172]
MKRWNCLAASLVLLSSINILILPAKAEKVCQVTDPTGTPLNIRDIPNGRIINKLKNGKEVYILEIAYDNTRRPWAKIAGYHNGKQRIWGWAFREFISCYNR